MELIGDGRKSMVDDTWAGRSEDKGWKALAMRRVESFGDEAKGGAGKVDPAASRKNADSSDLNSLLLFERLLSELSATFVNLPPDQVDTEIQRWIGRIGAFLEMDIGTVAQFSEGSARFTHRWAAESFRFPENGPLARDFPWMSRQLAGGRIVFVTDVRDLPEEAATDRAHFISLGILSTISIPLSVGGTAVGVLSFNSRSPAENWPAIYLDRYKLLGDIFANALMRKRSDKLLHNAFEEIKGLKELVEAENLYLRRQVQFFQHHEGIIGESAAVRQVLRQVEQVAAVDSTVLIQGETGTGKELIADAIHKLSQRRERAMVKVNCAAIPQTLMESELFGHERGAFTGASSRELGRFETAHRGTILLDEVGELPVQLQSKLLRVLQDGTFERLGSSKTIRVDVRVIASTNKDLKKAVREGSFRPDLYYRLNVFTITAPPLRERKEDIPALIWWFTGMYAKKTGKQIETIPRQAMAAYQRYDWPGNVRELMNAVERSVIVTRGRVLDAYIPEDTSLAEGEEAVLSEVERSHILKVLQKTGWRVRGQGGAAQLLGIKPTTLESRMQKLGIRRPGQGERQ